MSEIELPAYWLLAGCLLTVAARAAMMLLLLHILQRRGDLSRRHVAVRAALVLIGSAVLTRLATMLHEHYNLVWLQPAVIFASSVADCVVALIFLRFKNAIIRIPNRAQLEEKVLELERALAMQHAFERISLDAWITSRDGVVVQANERAGEIFRCEPAQLLGRPVLSLVAPTSRAAVQEQLVKSVASTYEFQILPDVGDEVWVEGRAAEVRTHDGHLERHSTFRDVTLYRKTLEHYVLDLHDLKRQREIREREDALLILGARGQKH